MSVLTEKSVSNVIRRDMSRSASWNMITRRLIWVEVIKEFVERHVMALTGNIAVFDIRKMTNRTKSTAVDNKPM
jgi:hypothetical protein